MSQKENKYYTPSIEEFCHGFSYELKCKYPNEERWEKRDYYWREDLPYSLEIRVKYLDQEDIESLGFNLVKEPEYKHLKKEVTLNYFPTSHSVLILSKGYNSDLKSPETKTEYWYQMFGGIIKNKSELKRLLKQLGIYEQ